MRRTATLIVLFAVVLAGCTAASQTPTDLSEPPSGQRSTASQAPPSTGADLHSKRSVEYVVRAGSIPETFSAVEITFQAVFVEQPTDLGSCYPDVFTGPYQPTLTPLPTPAGECTRSTPVTVDLADLAGPTSLGSATAPASTSGHALIATDVTVRRDNGSRVESVKNIGGAELIRSPKPPDGRYGLEVEIRSVAEERDYDYWLVWEQFDPSS